MDELKDLTTEELMSTYADMCILEYRTIPIEKEYSCTKDEVLNEILKRTIGSI